MSDPINMSDPIAEHTLAIPVSSADSFVTASTEALNNAPKQVGPYKILREVGRGAMGTVYEAKHAKLERRVALKVLPLDLASSPKRLNRFRREMAAVGRLDHPNIVLATDAGEIDGLCYIAMQFADGLDLEQVLEEIGRFEPADACEIIRQTALGLEHIGQQELVHRDLKPSNILLTRSGQAKILDLGIAMLRNAEQLETSMTLVGSMMGTPDYIAPEQITQCTDVDIRADIYSLGCTLYCLLSGKSPFNGPGYTTLTAKLLAHANKTPPSLAEAHAEIPEGIIALVEQMMSKDPGDRPSTPAEVAELIAPFCAGADLVPVATGQRKKGRLKPLDLPTAVDSEEASKNKSEKTRAPQTKPSFFAKRNVQKLICGTAAALLAGVFWLGATEPSSDDQKSVLVANKDFKEQVGQTQAMLASVNNSIAESAKINLRTSQQLSMTLSDMQKQFAKRQQEVGIQSVAIRNPQSPVDHYYNARLFSRIGDHENAQKSFLAYFADELPVVDPHLQFVALLKVREGVQGAREIYNNLPGDHEFVGRKLALAMLEPDQPKEALEQLITNHPDCSPAVYLLSQCFEAGSIQSTTLSQRRRQRELLHQFVSLHEQGQLLPYFLDQSIPASQLETARRQLDELNKSAAAPDRVPVSLTSLKEFGSHWRIGLRFDEVVGEIFWALDNNNEDYKNTGRTPGLIEPHSLTGKIQPNQHFEVQKREFPQTEKDSKIFVKYTNAAGEMQGPYELAIDVQATAFARKQNLLEMRSLSWARFKEDKLHFRLFEMRANDIIKAVRYSLNEEVPTLSIAVPEEELSTHNVDEFYLPVDDSIDYVSLQVTFTDGRKTKVVKIFRD